MYLQWSELFFSPKLFRLQVLTPQINYVSTRPYVRNKIFGCHIAHHALFGGSDIGWNFSNRTEDSLLKSSHWYRGVLEGVIEIFPLGQWIVSGLSSLTQFKFSCRTVYCIVPRRSWRWPHNRTTNLSMNASQWYQGLVVGVIDLTNHTVISASMTNDWFEDLFAHTDCLTAVSS